MKLNCFKPDNLGHQKRKSTFFKIVCIVLLGLMPAYIFGIFSGYKRLFPTKELFLLENQLVSKGSLLSGTFLMRYVAQSKPRNTLFQAFSPPSDVVMIGDSLTEDGLWSEIFPRAKIANRGIGGDRTIDILQRMEPIFAVKPKKAFILVGLNDFAYGVGVDQVFSNYLQIVQQLQQRGIKVFIQSTLECSKSSCGSQMEKVRALNQKLEGFAKANHIVYIDLNKQLSTNESGLLREYTSDGSHMLGSGYKVWASLIEAYVYQ